MNLLCPEQQSLWRTIFPSLVLYQQRLQRGRRPGLTRAALQKQNPGKGSGFQEGLALVPVEHFLQGGKETA